MAAGEYHSVVLQRNRDVMTWGSCGLLKGSKTFHCNPVFVLSECSAIAAGGSHALVLRTDGTLLAWGSNRFGQLGNGNTVNQNRPINIGTQFRSIVAGSSHSAAVDFQGQVWTWGASYTGQLGNPIATHSTVPVRLNSPLRFSALLLADPIKTILNKDLGIL